jgi:hypothetical protein
MWEPAIPLARQANKRETAGLYKAATAIGVNLIASITFGTLVLW